MKQAVDQIVTDYGLVLRAPEWTLVLVEDHVLRQALKVSCLRSRFKS